MIPQSIAHYKIISKLGEGGMGAVYRATDTKLNRDVALKILPPAFAEDTPRMARFAREAQLLAALNHPNIAAIYGIEEGAIVMELVEGDNLRGPVPVATAIEYARQIASGLEAAHEKRIIHRDLKPANIRVTSAGIVKILDFGLAKAADPDSPADASPTMSPTLSLAMTQAGVILGTAGYMSPEQARSKPVDKRADIWAFGVILYELLTGATLYAGETVGDSIAAVITREPDWSALPSDTPPHLRRLMERCLRKDPKLRLRDIGDARLALDEPDTQNSQVPTPSATHRSWLPWALVAICGVLAAGWWRASRTPEPQPLLRASILPPENAAFDAGTIPALSPDGRRLVFTATTAGRKQLWVRDLDSMASRTIPGSEDADYPFWSPDGRFVAFFTANKLKKADLSGGPAVTICDVMIGGGGTWNRNDVIVFAPGPATPLFHVPASGGTPVPLTTLAANESEGSNRYPWFLPDGRHFLFTARYKDAQRNAIYVGDLASKERVRLFAGSSNAVYTPPDLVLFIRGETLMAQQFEPGRMRISGEPVPIAEHVTDDHIGSSGKFTTSQTGMLAFYTGGSLVSASYLTWYDRAGKVMGTVGPAGARLSPKVSPNGDLVVEDRIDEASIGLDLWLHHVQGGTDSRLTFNQSSTFPVWSPDQSQIAFQSFQPDGMAAIHQKSTTGAGKEESLWAMRGFTVPTDWSMDGQFIIFTNQGAKTGNDIWALPLTGDRKPFPILQTPANEASARISPDGHWLAYQSDESGTPQIYVVAFPGKEGKWQISNQGGTRPVWGRDGKELFYIAADQQMTAVDVKTGAAFAHGTPRSLFETRTWPLPTFDISPDGKRFLIVSPAGHDSLASMTLMINWQPTIRK